MNQQNIRKLFKKYDVDFKGRKYLQKQLINRKINQRTIRNFLCQQGEKIQTIYCLLKGSIQIFYTLTHQTKQKIKENDEQKSFQYKNPKLEQQKIIFCTIQGDFEIINDEALIKLYQNQRKKFQKKQKKLYKINDLNNNLSSVSQSERNQQTEKQEFIEIKSRYTAIVTSSECQYIELTFNEAKALLKQRIQYIICKEMQRKKVIQESRRKFVMKFDQNLKNSRIQQIAMTNIPSHKFNSPKVIHHQSFLRQISDKVLLSKQNPQKSKNHRQSFEQVKRVKSISLLNINSADKNIKKKDQSLPLLNNLKHQLELFNQNQLILQKYRSKKAFEKFSPSHQSQFQKTQKLFDPISNTQSSIKNKNQDKLFKQNLKKIIKKKLNFQKKYGQTIKQFAHTSKPTNNVFSEQIPYNNKTPIRQVNERTSIQKSYSMDKLQILKSNNINKLSRAKLNTFGFLQENKQREKIKTTFYNQSDSKKSWMPKKIGEIRTSLNRQFQQPIQEFMDLQRMKKKLQQESLFLRLQNLDNYFDKME